ncbi:MAG TPA: energy transducer TonB [Saprospiraceae bacterium]|nr:energy transducer TonB [Saprospiraceae bacterium]
MDMDVSPYNAEGNKNKGMVASAILHILALLLCLLPFFNYEFPPKNDGGILIALGLPDEGEGDDNPESQQEEKVEPTSNQKENNETSEQSKSPDKADRTTTIKNEPVKVKETKTVDETSDIVSSADKKDTKVDEQKKLADKRRQEAEAKANEEAKKKADAEAKQKAEAEAKKKQFGGLFGKGQGDTGKTGSKGDPKGDPNSKVLEGLAKGSGRIGGGLSNRGLVTEPKFQDSSQKTGKVVISICVDKNGKVTDAKFTQRGSTTTDQELVEIARKGALRYVFTPGEAESQCGTVTVDFKVQ